MHRRCQARRALPNTSILLSARRWRRSSPILFSLALRWQIKIAAGGAGRRCQAGFMLVPVAATRSRPTWATRSTTSAGSRASSARWWRPAGYVARARPGVHLEHGHNWLLGSNLAALFAGAVILPAAGPPSLAEGSLHPALCAGRSPTDFVALAGIGLTLLNMARLAPSARPMLGWVATWNGPTIGAISPSSVSPPGANPRNIPPGDGGRVPDLAHRHPGMPTIRRFGAGGAVRHHAGTDRRALRLVNSGRACRVCACLWYADRGFGARRAGALQHVASLPAPGGRGTAPVICRCSRQKMRGNEIASA